MTTTTITIPRAVVEEALEALKSCSGVPHWPALQPTIHALRAALAQQTEPVQEPYTDDVTRIMREAGMTFHLGFPHKAVVEQMTRVVDLVYAEASIKAAQQFAAALAQHPDTDCHTQGICQRSGYGIGKQAEPVAVFDEQQGQPVLLSGAPLLADEQPLYTAPPQRKPLPKHDQHCVDVPGYGLMAVRLVRAIERAHGIGRQSDPQIEDRLARHGIPKP